MSTVVTLVVSSGSASDKAPVPSFTFAIGTPPADKSTVKFDGSASTDDGTIVKWVWEFGDGVTDSTSGKIVTHKYAKTGKYDVRLFVTDNAGHVVKAENLVEIK